MRSDRLHEQCRLHQQVIWISDRKLFLVRSDGEPPGNFHIRDVRNYGYVPFRQMLHGSYRLPEPSGLFLYAYDDDGDQI